MIRRRLVLTTLLAACSSGDGRDPSFASATETGGGPTMATDPTSSGSTGSESGVETTPTGGDTTPTGGDTTSTGGDTTSTGADTSESDPTTDGTTGEPLPDPFPAGHVFVVGFNDRLVFEFDAGLQPIGSWTHPSFEVAEGPAGMVFDYRGYLVVAAYQEFCVFSAPGEIETCHPKIKAQRTENVIFDSSRNLYTTTSTGGTDEIHKYDQNYTHITTFSLPTGNLTGITCDPVGDLFVASQAGPTSVVYKVSRDDLQVLDSFDVPGNAEGLQYGPDDDLLVALSGGVGIASVTPSSPSMVLNITADPGLLWPVPLTLDQAGNRYTGDFEDGQGAAASDLFVFAPDGSLVASRQPSELHGPFGLVVAGTSLPCGAVPPR
ncbi:hypothetical protein [Nannocystis sp. SCPEA4]|uniref:hypothetical protein n=1 Tax=Nannocystis sp. SCPEA4 TaxID=2996787 RepID=UPI002270D439|nr:hypothetical protein [Nannocystis sp. SCPEA4]MCY1059470.1 hypothetical protein [Nannocystis sp. SCPEA4]